MSKDFEVNLTRYCGICGRVFSLADRCVARKLTLVHRPSSFKPTNFTTLLHTHVLTGLSDW